MTPSCLARQGMTTSPDTLLRCLRHALVPAVGTPRVVGIDDWAFKRGRRYGTILVDLERRCPIDLLPDREAATVAQWFKTHPGVEVLSRDRAGAYAEGARLGAPVALQVADRWPLLKNLIDAFERFLHRHHAILRQAAQAVTAQQPGSTVLQTGDRIPQPEPPDSQTSVSQDGRQVRYEEIRELSRQGLSLRAIARHLRLHRQTIRRFATAEQFPERAVRQPRRSSLEPFVPTIQQRWEAGCHNAAALWRELGVL